MPATYSKHGLQFLYPENWQIKDQRDDELPFQVSLETPTGGMWSLNMFSATEDAEAVLDGAIAAMKTQYEDVEFSLAERDFEEFESRGVDANFFCLDFLVTAKIRAIQTDAFLLLVWFQAESRDFDSQHDVFRAVTQSLLQSAS